MKTITIISITFFFIQISCAQPSNEIVDYYRSKKNINFENFLFTPKELILYCQDSLGKSVFQKNLNRYMRNTTENSDEVKEKKVLITIVYSKVKQSSTKDNVEKESKSFIEQNLMPYLVDFPVDEKLLLSRFTWSESRSETCDIESSLYIFFVYDPLLYSKTIKKDKDLKRLAAPFPFSCTLENINIPISIRNKMKEGLLQQLKDYKEETLVNVSNSIGKMQLEN